MPFDRAYHTVVAGETLFFGSSADCKVYALDAATGAERWTFFTDSPVRFAPAVWKKRVFVVSDDGFLYCLSATDGKELWKVRGGPTDSMVLGNDRMISRWPARGGAAVLDGTVYFAAGVWPSEGTFLYALDAETGEVRWLDEESGVTLSESPEGLRASGGVSVQGYLAASEDGLLVPTGRSVPAVFSRSDGKLLYWRPRKHHWQIGGSDIVIAEGVYFNCDRAFDQRKGAYNKTISLAMFPDPGNPWYYRGHPWNRTVAFPGGVVTWDNEKIQVFRWAETGTTDQKGQMSRTKAPQETSRIPSPYREMQLIRAGDMLVAAGRGSDGYGVSLIDVGSKKTVWSASVAGDPIGLAVANGRLYVSTEKGEIYCFDGNAAGEAEVIEAKADASPYGDLGVFDTAAEEIVRETGLTEGYCLDLGCGDGVLAYALARRTKLHVYAIDKDAENVVRARERLDAAGLYGVRVTVHRGDPSGTPYPSYFADLIVSGRSVVEGEVAVPASEMTRLLRPYGGTACIGRPGRMQKTIRGELKGAGEWTHQYCDPANSNCSTDTLVRAPLGMLWFTDFGFPMPSRHGRGPAPLFHRGRLLVEGLNAIRAIDAYSGRMLWEYPLPGILKPYDQEHIMGTAGTGSNFCVTEDGLYVRTGGKCLRIDPAYGKLLTELNAPEQPDGKRGLWGYIACADGILFGTIADREHVVKHPYGGSDMRSLLTESTLLFALDAETGKLKWSYKPEHSIRNNAIAIGGGRVYLIDRAPAAGDRSRSLRDHRRDKTEIPEHPTGTLVALAAADGGLVWKSSEDIYGTMLALSVEHDVLLMSYQSSAFKLASELGGRMRAFRASDGGRLWDVEADYGGRLVLNGRTIYGQRGEWGRGSESPSAWDLLTGKTKDFGFSRYRGCCGTVSGSRNLLLFRSATASVTANALAYVDLSDNRGTEKYAGARPGCWLNALPAGGLVLMPDATDRCKCSFHMKASIALHPYGVRAPRISPGGGTFDKPVTVRLAAGAEGVDIRYTLDGRTPTLDSKPYTGSITVSETATLKTRAFRAGRPPSPINSAAFTVAPRRRD